MCTSDEAVLYQLEGLRPFGEWSLYTPHDTIEDTDD